MSIAYIQGDTLYGSAVTFFVGGTLKDKIKAFVNKGLDEGQFQDFEFDQFEESKDVIDWESKGQYRTFLIKILSKDLTCLNTDLSKSHEIYF